MDNQKRNNEHNIRQTLYDMLKDGVPNKSLYGFKARGGISMRRTSGNSAKFRHGQ
jgi:hypothetical protein